MPSQFKKRKLGNFCSLHPPQRGIEPGTSRSTSSAFTNVATKSDIGPRVFGWFICIWNMNVFLARLKAKKASLFHSLVRKVEKKWKKASYSPHSVFFSWLKDFPANLSFTRPFCSLADMKRPTQRSRLRLDHFVGLFMSLRLQKGLVNDNYAGKTFRHSNKTEWGK